MTINPASALGLLPVSLRGELLDEFVKIERNYRENRWEAAELNGGRFCEIVYTILVGLMDSGNYPSSASKPSRFNDACKALESRPATYPDSARLTIPRVLVGLYDIRNRRGVGHVGGEVQANYMDATYVLSAVKWVMAELVRIFHDVKLEEAEKIVEALTDRSMPLIWEVDGVSRVLAVGAPLADSTLLLLYASPAGLTETELCQSLEQSVVANYRRVLNRLHSSRLIEYNRGLGTAKISPIGVKKVEDVLIKKI